MGLAALITWLLAAGYGAYMLGVWIVRGGERQPGSTRLPSAVVFGHFALAVIGLLAWVTYLVVHSTVLAWAAFALLFPVAMLGVVMVVRWIPTYRARTAAGRSGGEASTQELAESHFPIIVVIQHGTCALITVVLVLLAALGVGPG